MIREERHGDVHRLVLATRASRLAGYTVSAYVIRDVLVDTGFPAIGTELDAWRQRRAPLRGVCVTHHHEDHAGNLPALVAAGLPVAAAPATLELLRHPERIRLYRRFTWGQPRPLTGRVVPLADPALALLATPGHCADHHVVWDGETGTVFGGDLFIGVKVRIAHPDEDPVALLASLRAMAARQPARWFDAHRGLVARPVAALTAKADWLEATIDAISRRIADGQTDATIRRAVLGGEGMNGVASGGEYSKIALVRAVRRAVGGRPLPRRR